MKKHLSIVFAAFLAVNCIVFFKAAAQDISKLQNMSREELEAALQSRSKELENINKELTTTNKNLEATKAQGRSLQRELELIKSSIKNLDLNIKKDEVSVQKLSLEIGELHLDIEDIQEGIASKQNSVSRLLQELQKTEGSNMLAAFLKHGTLAEGIREKQSFSSLQLQLSVDIDNLRKLNARYSDKLQQSSNKRTEIDKHQKSLADKKQIVESQKQERQQILSETKNQESIYQQQVAQLKKQQQQIAQEAEALDSVLRTKINPSALPGARHGVLGMPVVGGTLTQDYGSTDFAKYGYRGKWHNGVDFGVPVGTPILAAENGTVVASGNQDSFCPKGAYGKFAVINHTNNLTSLYGHLSQILVTAGETVKRGQIIGYSGKTGYATGPHLHFTVYAQSTFYMNQSKSCGPMPQGGDLNPTLYL